jgi:hypothetical protein
MLALSTTSLRNVGERIDFYDRVLERVRAQPGIVNGGMIGDIFVNSGSEQMLTIIGNTTSHRSGRHEIATVSTSFGSNSTDTRLLKAQSPVTTGAM